MNLVCLGVSHQTASVEIRERFAVPDGELSAAVAALARRPGIAEAVIVSTCNRVEFYAAAAHPPLALASIRAFLEERQNGRPPLPATAGRCDPFFTLTGSSAVTHLFRVVSGIESMVIGETEILGQVKKAYAAAAEAGATARLLNKLFQKSFNVAKEVRTLTYITRGSVSVGSVAVDLAGKVFEGLSGCRVMILGAGETSELTARALQSRGVKSLFVSNRSYDRAAALACAMGGEAIHFHEWDQHFHETDILISSTSAPHILVTAAKLAPMMEKRPERPLFVIDLAVPRDVEPAVARLPGVHLYDIDSLQAIVEQGLEIRRLEATRCSRLIERHAADFSWLPAPAVSQTA